MKAEEVARYLHNNPEFFDQYADVLAMVTLPDPHSGRAISISEKQLFNLRDKVRTLQAKLDELIGFGDENDAIAAKVHALGVALIAAKDQVDVVQALYGHLAGAFVVPHVTLRLWGAIKGAGREFETVSDSAKTFALGLQRPYCGTVTGQESLVWFGEAASHLRSMAQVSLRDAGGDSFGLLVMATEEPHRFYPELGTVYLQWIGAMASAALLRVAD